MEISWRSCNYPDYPYIWLPFASEPTSNRSPHRYYNRFTILPQQSVNTHQFHCCHTLKFLSFCKSQLTPPAHNLAIPLPIVSTCQFRRNKINLASLGNRTRTLAVGAGRHNHHTTIYRRVPNFRLDIFLLA